MRFFERIDEIDRLRALDSPGTWDTDAVVRLIEDERVGFEFFRERTDGGQAWPSVEWVRTLKERGVFDRLSEQPSRIGSREMAMARYLVAMAKEVPEEVLEIICATEGQDAGIQERYIEALRAMPPAVAVRGVWVVTKYLAGRHRALAFVAQRAGELVTKLAPEYANEAFGIARALLDVWKPEEGRGRDIGTKFFDKGSYQGFVFKEYVELRSKYPWRAWLVLAQTLDAYLCELGDDDYMVTSGFVHMIQRLDEPHRNPVYANDIPVTLVRAICEAGKVVIEKEPQQVTVMLDDLERRDKPIFWRILMHLLGFVGQGVEVERLNRIIGDRGFLDEPWYEAEYKLLLNDRFEDVDSENRDVFERWIEEQGINDREGWEQWFQRVKQRAATEGDFQAADAAARARALYLVKERYREKFDEYIEIAGIEEEAAAPQASVRESRFVGPGEGAECSEEKWQEREPSAVIDLCISRPPDAWKKKPEDIWNADKPAIEVQAAVLKDVVQKRAADYVAVGAERIAELPRVFLNGFMWGLADALRGGQVVETVDWEQVIQLVERIVEKYAGERDYRGALKHACSPIEVAFDNDPVRENVVRQDIQRTWEIVWGLVQYEHDEKETPDVGRRDYLTACINTVRGSAFQLAIRLGVICKNNDGKTGGNEYESQLSKKLKACLDLILCDNRPQMLCPFGLWLPQLCYLEEEWVRAHADQIFDAANADRWAATWGTYLCWGRTSRTAFELLKEKGRYRAAIEKLGETDQDKHGRKTIDEGLAQHLMIAYFNGWMEYEDPLLSAFFEKASAELRGYAASFMTTGFKPTQDDQHLDEKGREPFVERMRRYWQERLAVGEADPNAHQEELRELSRWVKDTLLPADETLALLRRTLAATGGKVGHRRQGVRDVVEGLCQISNGQEKHVLECLNELPKDQEFLWGHSVFKDALGELLDRVAGLDNAYPAVGELRKAAMKLADDLGRMGIMDYRSVYERLRKLE